MAVTIPAYFLGACCKAPHPIRNNKLTSTGWMFAATLTADTLITVTTLVMAVLGALSVVAMPAALTYSLFAIGGFLLAVTGAFDAFAIENAVKGLDACKGKSTKNVHDNSDPYDYDFDPSFVRESDR